MDRRKWCAWRKTAVGVCIASLVVVLLGSSHPVEGLRCRTGEGPSNEDVKRIVRTCLNRIMNAGSENRTDDEYPNYDSRATNDSSEEVDEDDEGGGKSSNRRSPTSDKSYLDRQYDGSERGNGRMNWPDDDGRRRYPTDRMDQRNRPRMGDRGREWDRQEEEQQQMMMRDYGRKHHRRKRQYYGGPELPSGPVGDYSTSGRISTPSGSFPDHANHGNGSQSTNASLERDRACLMQCFFEELKTTNGDGLPEKHKVLHVITKDIHEHELREFYVDSIQECFHMLGMDNRLKDKCDYSMRFVTCLTDRFQSNCDDWDGVTSAMF